MADEIALCLMGDYYTSFIVTRSNGEHSGNWNNLGECLTKVFIDGQKMKVGYYEHRLDDARQIAPAKLLRWGNK